VTAPPASATRTEADEAAGATPPTGPPRGLAPLELGRWAWRQLTSMRTALLLLLLLALAAVPGSVVPQSNIAAAQVSQWKEAHPGLAPLYERLGLFSVYDSPWFSAIYLLLMVSLVGCILPRSTVYLRALRTAPPKAPRNLGRLPAYVVVESDEPPAVLIERARQGLRPLRGRRYRLGATEGDERTGLSFGAERGHLREAGNLLFHVSVIVVLIGFACGQLFGFKGGSIVLVGQGFSNSLTQYDDFSPGSFYDPANLKPMSLTVDSFDAKFLTSGPHEGQPVDFGADITYRETPSASPHRYRLAVNKPLTLDGVSVYLVGHGYAPKLTVRDGNGDVAYSGPVIFLPQDASFASFGVLKVPDAQPQQLGFEGMFFPTYSFTMARGPFSVFPDALRPAISMLGYHGDLGMDTGKPQSVFDLDTSHLAKFKRSDGRDFRLDMVPGQRVRLPDGLGSVRFDGWQRWVKLQVSNSPGKGIALTGVVLALVGLSGSLFIRRRRTWVRVTRRDGRSYVEVAGLDRSSLSEGLEDEVRRVARTAVPGAEERLA
jgi:cytochrome c biogenesis protein